MKLVYDEIDYEYAVSEYGDLSNPITPFTLIKVKG